MTLERLYGSPLTDLNAIRDITGIEAAGADVDDNAERILITALNTWFGSVLACESFHADVHAGNLLVTREGRVAFIDFGIVGRISPAVSCRADFLSSNTSRDYTLMAKSSVQMGLQRPTSTLLDYPLMICKVYMSLWID